MARASTADVNDLDGDDAGRAASGPNYDRVLDVERRYDTENVFHVNHDASGG